MTTLARTDTSLIGRWWWTVDRWSLAALAALIGFGVVLAMAAGPPVAARIGAADSLQFVKRHLLLLPPALTLILGVSLMSPRQVRRLAAIMFVASILLLLLTLVVGTEINGARRWLVLAGLSLQPSEFAKPAFAVVAAWLFAQSQRNAAFPGKTICAGLFAALLVLLLAQPDLGQAVVVSAVWAGQFFLAGLPLSLVFAMALSGIAGLAGAYFVFPHVASRIDGFLDPAAGDSYQIDRSLQAFMNGGLFGRGPGEGTIKDSLPDAHADFIFAVAGEELGLLACLALVLLFAFIVLRGFARVLQDENLFVTLAAAGLLIQFGLQALINMASSLDLMPTKGMTLPFVSYGGSSLIAIALGIGMVLALTRRRAGGGV